MHTPPLQAPSKHSEGIAPSAKAKAERRSNIELLRILAMFMILVLHTSYDGVLSWYDGVIDASHVTRFLFQSLAVVGVNLFVLISGYFGIRLRRKGVARLVFQAYFFGILGLAAWLCMQGTVHVETKYCLKALFPLSHTVWFIPCYFVLMLFSPMLNAFVEKSSTRQIVALMAAFYAVNYWWGVVFPVVGGWGGYSWGWFLILYLTGRLIRRHTDSRPVSGGYALAGYALCTVALVGIALLQNYVPVGKSLVWSYDCPLVYASAVCLFLFFVQLRVRQSRFVNWLAASAFAVLLLHCSPFWGYKEVCKAIYDGCSGISCVLLTALYAVFTYFAATLIDQVRVYMYNKVFSR